MLQVIPKFILNFLSYLYRLNKSPSLKISGDEYMKWYYAERKKPFGPIDENEFRSLIENGTITPITLVWRSGMKEWQPLSEVSVPETAKPEEKKDVEVPAELRVFEEVETEYEPVENFLDCSACGQEFDRLEMIFYRNQWICPSCKALSAEKPEDTKPIAAGGLQYGDFWVRAVAKIIDVFILGSIGMFISFFLGFFIAPTYDSEVSMTFNILANFVQIVIAVSYTTYFLGKYSATPGKMACHLKVVTPVGGKISYSQACYRYFAEILSSLIFCIGYLMAIFDKQRRTLHDRIAGTRVVKSH
jgi:uncharacterized RDD family membrane protein YckC